jgi:glycosyltransferase involved in cell wall biosynthesis
LNTGKFSKLTINQKNDIKLRYSNTLSDTLFLIPSRLEPRKGIIFVIEAAKILKRLTHKGFKILFTGSAGLDDDYTFNIFRYCQKNELFNQVNFVDTLSRNENLYALYKVADCVVMPSTSLETLGLVTLESLSFGTPVLGFDTCATSEILSKYDSHFLINTGDAKKMALSMNWFMNLSVHERSVLKKKAIFIYKNWNKTFQSPSKYF